MVQKSYRTNSETELSKIFADIRDDPDYQRSADRALLLFESETDREKMSRRLRKIHEALPEVKVFGMTLMGPVGSGMVLPDYANVSLLLMERSSVDVRLIDCRDRTAAQAGELYLDETEGLKDRKGILVMTSGSDLAVNDFLNCVDEKLQDVPLFGALAGTWDFRMDEPAVFAGTQISPRAILAVTFCGRDLLVETCMDLGWKPLGIPHVFTEVQDDVCVKKIDGERSVDLYQKYLNIAPDENFLDTAAAFPLIELDGTIPISRVPIRVLEDGSLIFTTGVVEGETFSLSYSRPEALLRESLICADRIAAMKPQCVLMVDCLNRRLFLGNDRADREIGYFYQALPDTAVCFGSGEILKQGGNGGVLNSSMVAAGIREGTGAGEEPVTCQDEELDNNYRITTPDRLVRFLQETTRELWDTIDDLKGLVVLDQLTGIANRRAIDSAILNFIQEDHPFAALMFDIDFFKRVNDSFGHQIGDCVLCELADLVNGMIRETDLFGRWGGEEFVCLFPDTGRDEAAAIAERIRGAVDETQFTGAKHITISIGVTRSREDDDVDSLFERMDRALYMAKESGRNCVKMY